MKIVVVGAGISGLAAAFSILKDAPQADLTVLESGLRLGGIISTRTENGCIVEEGPDSFITTKPWALDLCLELGIANQLIFTNESNRRALIASGGRLLPLPEGFVLLSPTKIWPFLDSQILSMRGKIMVAGEILRGKNSRLREETLKQFVVRRFGDELFERIAQPMAAGIYTGDPEKLSAQATLPQFVELERKYGSVIKGMLMERVSSRTDGGARYSAFVSLKNGMQSLVESLADAVGRDKIQLGCAVQNLERRSDKWKVCTNNQEILADFVVLAIPVKPLGKIMRPLDSELAADLESIELSSCAVLNLLFNQSDIDKPIDGFGFVVPEKEGKSLIACSFSSNKFAGRAPTGKILLRAFLGGALHPEIFALSDSGLVKVALDDLRTYLGITSYPEKVWIKRWTEAMPQYYLGHLDLVERLKVRFANLEGLSWAGSALQGVGIPDCVRSGLAAAQWH